MTDPDRQTSRWRGRRSWPVLLVIVAAVGAVAVAVMAPAGARSRNGAAGTDPVEFADVRLKFEINATDGDGGVQLFVDGEQWRSFSVHDPDGRPILTTRTTGSMAAQGGTELFLESAEPTFDELPLAELLARFPEGDYAVTGRMIDGRKVSGSASLSHRLPDGPTLLAPLEGDGPQDPAATTLQWEPVDAPDGGAIVAYQVIVVDPETDLAALPTRELDVTVPSSTTSLAVPVGFLESGTEYEWEVLAIDDSGNQTLSSSMFTTG